MDKFQLVKRLLHCDVRIDTVVTLIRRERERGGGGGGGGAGDQITTV